MIEVCVLGSGAAGIAITSRLAAEGVRVVAVSNFDPRSASLVNQKWWHSGLYYRRPALIRSLGQSFLHSPPVAQRHMLLRGARFLARNAATAAERVNLWSHREVRVPFEALSPEQWDAERGENGLSDCAVAFRTPDCVMDFPTLLSSMSRSAMDDGAEIIGNATVKNIVRDGDRIVGVVCARGNEEFVIRAELVVTALGAWTPELLEPVGVLLPIARWKSHLLTVDAPLVGHLTAYLDEPFVSMVPFRGRTLVGDARRRLISSAEDRGIVRDDVEALKHVLAQTVPLIDPNLLRSAACHACVKTELNRPGLDTQELTVWTARDHGIANLIVTLPGKASFLFHLARRVSSCVTEGWAEAA